MLRNDEISSPVLGFASSCRGPRLMQKAHRHHELEINFLPAGSMTYLATDGIVSIPAERLAVFWAAAPHQLIGFEAVESFYWFTIPFAWVTQWQLPGSFLNALLHGRFLVDEVGDLGDALACARWHRDLESGDSECVYAAQLEMEARLRRFVRHNRSAENGRISPRSSTPVASRDSIDAVQKMAELIARQYTHELTVAQITEPTGFHPNYAMTIFRSTCGMSVLEYVLQHRLFHARRLLATTDHKIIDVALESGFGSLSRFYEAFTRANGCSPQQFRKRIRATKLP